MAVDFQTEYLFKRLSDFWSFFEDREEVKNVWDAYLKKAQDLQSLLFQADFSKSLKTIPLFDRSQLEYFVFPKLVRRADLEVNEPFYVFEVDPEIFFIKTLNERIDDTNTRRELSPGLHFRIARGSGKDEGKTFLEFIRGVRPESVGETFWTKGSDVVTGTGLSAKVVVGDILQGPNSSFFKVTSVPSDTQVVVQGHTVLGQSLGPGDGVTTLFNLRTPPLFSEVSDELVLTGIVPAGSYTLANLIFDPESLEFRKGPTFETGVPLLENIHFSVVNPNTGAFALSSAGASFLGNEQLHARYLKAEPSIVTSGVEVFFDGVVVPPANYTVTPTGILTFGVAPFATVGEITVDYYLGYPGPSGTTRKTIRESIPSRLFSRAVYRDRRSVFRNFGTAIGLDEPTTETYLNRVRGIYFARYNGPTITNMSLGSGILIGLPFSERGRVDGVQPAAPKSVIVGGKLFPVVPPLTPSVSTGQQLARDFNLLTNGVRTADFRNDPIFDLAPLKTDPQKFFTFFVIVSGAYAIHVAVQTGKPIDYTLLKRFKRDIKPSYTDCWVLTELDFLVEPVNFFIGAVDVTNALDAVSTTEFNCTNYAVIPEFMQANGFPFAEPDELVAAGPVAAGVFALQVPHIVPGTLELHGGTIAGPQLTLGAHYTEDLALGIVTLTAAGAALVNAQAPPDLHAKYTSGLVGQAALEASGLCGLDPDEIALNELLEFLTDSYGISTLENNLVNFDVSPPGPESMDDSSIPMFEALSINEAVGTPPGSFIPPFTSGALIYSF